MAFFSAKNNLPYTVSHVRILILVYDATGTVVDYNEATYFVDGIKPYLARTINFDSHDDQAPQVAVKTGYKAKARVLDFEISEE
jgi:hypothetical protein